MNKLDMLFIRACKSKDAIKRLNSLYYRFYGVQSRTGNERHFIDKLAILCDTYGLISVTQLIRELNPANAWKYDNSVLAFNNPMEPTPDFRLGVLISVIRLSEVDRFPGLISPVRFRR